MNDVQAVEEGWIWRGRAGRVDVLRGSNRAVEGVMSALRFCIMESSIVEREMRRKSRFVSGWRGRIRVGEDWGEVKGIFYLGGLSD